MGPISEQKNSSQQTIALCIYDYPWTVSPSILNTAHLLAEAGYEVDILVRRPPAHPYIATHENISVHHYLPAEVDQRRSEFPEPLPAPRRWARQILPDIVYRWLSPIRRFFWAFWIEFNWFHSLWRYANWLVQWARKRDYVALIGMDRSGFIPAAWAGWRSKRPAVYYSLELYLADDDPQFRSRLLKRLERRAHRCAAWTIVQDQERARCLAEENRVPMDDFVLVPVSALGPASLVRSNFLRKRLGIPPDKVIVLSAGGIAHYNLCKELAQVAQTWPEDWVLVLHGYVPDPAYLEELRPFGGNGRVYLSTDLVPYEELDALIGSADIGVALYKDLGPNFQHIVLSSGKLAQYLKVGLPVVVTAFPAVRRFFDVEGCGVAVNSVHDVESAIHMILVHIDNYRRAALCCYDKYYNMRTHFQAVLARLEAHRSSKAA